MGVPEPLDLQSMALESPTWATQTCLSRTTAVTPVHLQ